MTTSEKVKRNSIESREIAQNEWEGFCETFSRQHRGWLVTVVSTDGVSTKTLAHDLPLREVHETQHDGQAEITITLGRDDKATSILAQDVEYVFQQMEMDKDIGLRIDSADAHSTIVHFRTPANPQQLDGLAMSEL